LNKARPVNGRACFFACCQPKRLARSVVIKRRGLGFALCQGSTARLRAQAATGFVSAF